MKKNVLALSITAALLGLGYAGGAQAVGLTNLTPPTGIAASLRTSPNGIGHFLYVPYYSAQGNNNTMINIVNTDTTNGKAVKVRFRGAGNSDDVFDFQVFLSPGDVWTASVSQNSAGLAKLTTADNSCTKPAKSAAVGDHGINDEAFHTARMNNFRAGDLLANETREGYVEIFNMADIPSGSGLFTAIKHKNSVPPCSGTLWEALDVDYGTEALAIAGGLALPTTGLMANWIILNAADGGAWSGAATAINAVDTNRVPTTGSLAYFPQTNFAIGLTDVEIALFTADPWLRTRPTYAAAYDLPDFSIPYTSFTTPALQVAQLAAAIATTKVANEFLTLSSLSATGINTSTDWVLSMPTRRYNVAYDYFSTATGDKRVFTTANAYFTGVLGSSGGNTTVIDKQVCVTGITYTSYDQEENTESAPGDSVIVSPVLPGLPNDFIVCGEASVLSFNRATTLSAGNLIISPSGTLQGTVARSSIDNGYQAGWNVLATPNTANDGIGLPILGYEAVRATNAPNTYGATLPHRTNLLQN